MSFGSARVDYADKLVGVLRARSQSVVAMLSLVAVAPALGGPPADCVCQATWNVGDAVIRVADAGGGGPPFGSTGVVVCGVIPDQIPETQIFVSWNSWSQGHSGNNFCGCPTQQLPAGNTSGWFVACEDILALGGVTTVTFQQGVGGYASTLDTFLSQSAPATIQGALLSMKWDTDEPGGSGLDSFVLIRFDNVFGGGAGQIPPGAAIIFAALNYEVFNGGNPGSLYESAASWNESTTFNGFGGTPGVQASEFGAFVDTVGGYAIGAEGADVTSSLQRAAPDPPAHRGWIVLPSNFDGVEIRSSEYGTVAQRPKLTVSYTLDPVTPHLRRRPYLQNASTTSIVVAWRTSMLTDSRVRYGSTFGLPDHEVTDAALKRDHAVALTGLQAGTTYYYDVGTTSVVLAGGDADHAFVMPSPIGPPAPLRLWVMGDSGFGNANQLAVRDAMLAHTAGDPPDFVLHMGDIVYQDGTDSQYTARFFTAYQGILRHTVCWTTHGNHDGHSSNSDWPAGAYYEAFTLPAGGEAGGLASGTEAYYSFDVANVHFICLNSYNVPRQPGSAMLNWLTADLAATRQEWVVVYFHHPPYTRGTHNSDDPADSAGAMIDMREGVLPILEGRGVDLVLSGHSHGYERSFLVDGAYDTPTTPLGHIVDGGDGRPGGSGAYRKPRGRGLHRGTVYVVSGHCGAPIGGLGGHPLMYRTEIAYGSCLLDVDRNALSFTNVRSDGVVSDTFQIIKGGACPADWDADGVVNSQDFFDFLGAFFAGAADFNMTGTTDSQDFFDFLAALFAGC